MALNGKQLKNDIVKDLQATLPIAFRKIFEMTFTDMRPETIKMLDLYEDNVKQYICKPLGEIIATYIDTYIRKIELYGSTTLITDAGYPGSVTKFEISTDLPPVLSSTVMGDIATGAHVGGIHLIEGPNKLKLGIK